METFNDPFDDIFELDIVPNQYPAPCGEVGFEFEQFGSGLASVFDILVIFNTWAVAVVFADLFW